MPRPRAEDYEPVDTVPEGIRWKPAVGRQREGTTVLLSTPGSFYRLVRELATGTVAYFRRKDMGPEATPKEKLDAEPEREKRPHFGSKCWYVENSRWFLVNVERPSKHVIVLRSETGQDADRTTAWPYGADGLEVLDNSPVYKRLRPLRDRYH